MRVGRLAIAVVIVGLGPAWSAAPEATATRVVEGPPAEEFVGPFPSWTNVKAAYGAVGDGVADDTAALQAALTELGTAGRSPVLFLPAGAYRITHALVWLSGLNASVVGEDPETTAIVWDGAAGGTMLEANGLAYSRVVRLTFDGRRRAAVAVDQSWDGTRPTFDTGNEYADDRFVDVDYGIRGGFKGHGFAETSVVRAWFVRNAKAGVALGNFNALDLWIRDSLFDRCGTGVTNATGAGNFHVYDSVFRQSKTADLAMKNTGGFSARGNYSTGSRAFFVSLAAKAYPAIIHLQRNAIVNPTASPVVDLRNQGPGLLTDNVIQSAPGVPGPVVAWSGVDGADVVSIGNTFTVADPIRVNGRFVAIDDRTVARESIAAPEPALPGAPRHLSRPVIEVARGARAADIQRAIDRAALQTGTRPIVHLPYGTYPIGETVTVPASDIQVVGDGFGTVLRWSGRGRGPLITVSGPSKVTFRELQLDGAKAADSLVVEAVDQPGARVHLDQVQLRAGKDANLLVDGLNHALVELRDAGDAYSPDGTSIKATGRSRTNIFSGAASGNGLTYDVSGGARVLVRDLWYESRAGPAFTRVQGSAAFTVDGVRVASAVDGARPAFDLEGLKGRVAILAADIDDRIVVSGNGSEARVLGLGLLGERASATYFTTAAAPPARTLLLSSRQRGAGGRGNRSVPTPDAGAVDPEFVRELLAQTRGEMPEPLTSLPVGVTDFRLFRVWVANGLRNIILRP